VVFLPAWGASVLWDRLRNPMTRRVMAAAFGVIAVASTGLAYRDYFIVLANDPALYYAFDVDKVETSDWVNHNATKSHIFLAPVWYQVGTISLLTRNAPLKSFESRDTIILPSSAGGEDALYAFPLEQVKKAQTLQTRLGGLATEEGLTGSNGGKELVIYRVAAKNLPDPQNPLATLARGGAFIQPQTVKSANWADQIRLLGYTSSPEGPGGRNLTVTLFLQSLKPMSDDYTFSIKVRDAKDRVWGQEDKWPGDNSYATTQWSVGDVIVEKFYPGLNACAPAGKYQVTVEAYNPKTMQVLRVAGEDTTMVSLGILDAGASESNRLEDLEPDHAMEASVGKGLQLLGYTVTPETVRAGENLSVSLFWRGAGNGSREKVSVRLGDNRLMEGAIQIPVDGRGLCSFYDLTVPAGAAEGPAGLWVNDTKLTDVTVSK
jgi:hypothetical protein